jgi:hypothetical protein
LPASTSNTTEHQRQARVDHRGELAREDHDVARRDAGPRQRDLDLLGLLAHRHQHHPVLAQVPQQVIAGGHLEGALEDLPGGGVLGGVFVNGHLGSVQAV